MPVRPSATTVSFELMILIPAVPRSAEITQVMCVLPMAPPLRPTVPFRAIA